MNGASVIARTEDCIYIRIPPEQQRECGGCRCSFCAAHPELTPKWDTLVVATSKLPTGNDYAWNVHMPDPTEFRARIEATAKVVVVYGGRVKRGQ